MVVTANGFASNPDTLPVMSVEAVANANISCHGGSNGSAIAIVSKGKGPYSYSWFNGNSLISTSNPTGPILSSGTYSVTIISAAGCTASASITITEPPLLMVTSSANPNVLCHGGDGGKAIAVCSGGKSPYTYKWSNNLTTDEVSNLLAGFYTVTVTDNNGCTATATAGITQPALLVGDANTVANVSCYQGSDAIASANPNGGSVPYSYLWSQGGTSSSITGLTAGVYSVTITDVNGCAATADVIITQPAPLALDKGSKSPGPDCDGSAWVTVTGGTSPYTFLWTAGQTTDSISNQCTGIYCCTVTDAHGCTNLACISIGETGIEEVSGNSGILIYPNPNHGIFMIQSSVAGLPCGSQGCQPSVEVFNIYGQKIYSQFSNFNSPLSINLSSQPAGVYLVRLITGNGETFTRKMVKE